MENSHWEILWTIWNFI